MFFVRAQLQRFLDSYDDIQAYFRNISEIVSSFPILFSYYILRELYEILIKYNSFSYWIKQF